MPKSLITLDQVKEALALPDFDGRTAQLKMAPVPRAQRRPPTKPGQARLGGVLVLLFCRQEELNLVLTRRRDDLNSHAGQISFPGGQHEALETLEETALREAYEEVGVPPQDLNILGQLTPLYILPSDFEVHPTVASFKNGQRPRFTPNNDEVAELLEVPVGYLLDPTTRGKETWTLHGYELLVPFFEVQGHKVWGATAMMLSELLERVRFVSNQ